MISTSVLHICHAFLIVHVYPLMTFQLFHGFMSAKMNLGELSSVVKTATFAKLHIIQFVHKHALDALHAGVGSCLLNWICCK